MKKLFTLFLLALLPLVASAYDAKIDGIYYNLNSSGETKTAEVTYQECSDGKYTSDYSGDVVIPESVMYRGVTYSVTSIGSWAFTNCRGLTSVTIPNSVTSIGSSAFFGCSSLTSVTIPNSVTSINDFTFYCCSALTSIEIPSSVISLGHQSISCCHSLTSVTIPNSVTSIVGSPFCGCRGLTSVKVLCSPTTMESDPFSDCLNLKEVTFDCETVTPLFRNLKSIEKITMTEKVTSISKNAFSGFSSLTSITIPNSVTSIGESAFSGCSSLTSVDIPNSVTSIGGGAFSGCSGLTSVTIPNSVTSIDGYAFKGCSGLTFIEIPNSVTSIGSGAFKDCSGLTFIDIPNSVTSIGSSAFYGCSSLTSVTIPNGVTSIYDYTFKDCSGLTFIDIPNSVTSIGSSAFYGCSSLTTVTIPNSVTSIGNQAFSGCTGLTSVSVLCSPTSIGSNIFKDCSNIKEVTFDCEKVTSLFKGETSIEKAIITGNVTSSSDNAFEGCILTKVELHCETVGSWLSGVKSIKEIIIGKEVTTIGSSAFKNCSGLVSAVIGSGLTSIGYGAFSNTNLKKTIWLTNTPPSGASYAEGSINYVANEQYNINNKVVYPLLSSYFDVDGIRYVPVSLSERTCDAIDCVHGTIAENVMIGPTVEYKGVTLTVQKIQPYLGYNNEHINSLKLDYDGELGMYAFTNCSNINSITLGNNITSIGEYAFDGCSSVEKIKIKPLTTDIKRNAFSNCSSLKEVIIEDGETELNLGAKLFAACPLDTVYIGRNINYSTKKDDGYSPFYSNTSLRAVKITDKETEISENEFYGCTNLQRVIIGDGVTTIGNWAFSGCSSLKFFTFGSEVKTIGQEAFSDCSAVAEITSRAATPPTCGTQALDDINKWECKLYVPKGCLASYQAAEQWKEFLFAEEGEFAKDEDQGITIVNKKKPVSVDGETLYEPSEEVAEAIKETYETDIALPAEAEGRVEVTDNGGLKFSKGEDLLVALLDLKLKDIVKFVFTGRLFGDSSKLRVKNAANLGTRAAGDMELISEAEYEVIEEGDQIVTVKLEETEATVETITVTEQEKASITIGKSGKVSYCGDKSLDFSFSDEIKAYIATGFDKDAEIIWLTRVKDVPAGTPVLIKGEANKTYDVPVTDTKNSYYENLFKGNTSGATVQVNETDGNMVNYYLSGDGTFKSVKGYVNIGNNKSYLQLPGTFKPAEAGATQTVKVGSAGKASFAAPVDLDFTNVEGLKAFTATGYDKSSKTIWLTRVMKVQKGEGVLLKGDEGDYEIPSVAVQSSYMNMFVGNTSGASVQVQEKSDDGKQTNFYLKGDGTFVSVNGYVNIGNNKCYLALPTEMVSAAASTRGSEANYLLEEPEVIKMPISFRSLDNDGNGTTAIREAKQSKKDGAYYTLQGQRVQNPGKGLYIKNGKVVVIK